MAELTGLIDFNYGTYDKINNATKNAEDIYFATDKPLFYAQGQWYGVSDIASSVDASTGTITLTLNSSAGKKITGTITGAGMTTSEKSQLKTAYDFVTSISGSDTDTIINKWGEIVAFLNGMSESDTLVAKLAELNTAIDNEVTARKGITVTAGNGLTGGGKLSGNITINMGTPTSINATSTNTATADSHTHTIAQASTTQKGIVKLVDELTSSSDTDALTAKQGNILETRITDETTARITGDEMILGFIGEMFTPVRDENGILTSVQVNVGLWTNEFISARGKDGLANGGAVDLESMWGSLTGSTDAFKDTKIGLNHIPTGISQANISGLEATIKTINSNITANQNNIATNTNSIASLKTSVSTINTTLGNQATTMNNALNRISAVESALKWKLVQ